MSRAPKPTTYSWRSRRALTARTESDLLAPLDDRSGAATFVMQPIVVGRPDLDATLRTRRQNIRELIEGRFKSISPEVEAVIAGTEDEDDLRALFRRAIIAPTQRDLLDSDYQIEAPESYRAPMRQNRRETTSSNLLIEEKT